MRNDVIDSSARRGFGLLTLIAIVVGIIVFLAAGPFRTVPAGHVGIKDFFGNVSTTVLSPGINVVMPMTRVVQMSVQTQEIKEVAEVAGKPVSDAVLR
jgi:regulator of protease activity HflC (stomatin/prohibitin superfamily)